MSEPATISLERLSQLTDQLWRRLGISETFDRLLVRHIAIGPGDPADIRERASEGMGAGAARFFGLTFDKMVDTLQRREIVQEREGGLELTRSFAEKIEQAIDAEEQGVSRVDPTPGVTLEDIQRRAAERARPAPSATARARASAASAPRAPRSTQPRSRKASSDKVDVAAPTPAPRPVTRAAPTPKRASAKELFSSRKLNRLLDSLDAPLFKDQVGQKVDLRGPDLDRFLEITAALDIVRFVHDGMVELHWKGRELARTVDGDRRMALVDIVRALREQAEG